MSYHQRVCQPCGFKCEAPISFVCVCPAFMGLQLTNWVQQLSITQFQQFNTLSTKTVLRTVSSTPMKSTITIITNILYNGGGHTQTHTRTHAHTDPPPPTHNHHSLISYRQCTKTTTTICIRLYETATHMCTQCCRSSKAAQLLTYPTRRTQPQ